MEKTPEQIQQAIDNIRDNRQLISERLSGMNYAEGLIESLEWILGTCEDRWFTGTTCQTWKEGEES